MSTPDSTPQAAADAVFDAVKRLYERPGPTWRVSDDEIRAVTAAALAAAVPLIRADERQRIRRELIEGDPGKLEAAFREFVEDEEAADCALVVADLLAGDVADFPAHCPDHATCAEAGRCPSGYGCRYYEVAGEVAASGEHDYLSTACLHERHADCRKVCKFCPAACSCTYCGHADMAASGEDGAP